MPALTDTAIRTARLTDKPRKLSDTGGLYLLIAPTGGKLWRMKYRFDGKEKTLAFGKYPEVSLKDARDRLLASGADPAAVKKAQKAERQERAANNFGECLRIDICELFLPSRKNLRFGERTPQADGQIHHFLAP
ncbi:MAG: Arm DNA-binding domain-containing protein [Azoarcus sp.]|jgi:hypothetical protein|nr:Arm DNA-binding domain-containing protein [Azoarcus sp.]